MGVLSDGLDGLGIGAVREVGVDFEGDGDGVARAEKVGQNLLVDLTGKAAELERVEVDAAVEVGRRGEWGRLRIGAAGATSAGVSDALFADADAGAGGATGATG